LYTLYKYLHIGFHRCVPEALLVLGFCST